MESILLIVSIIASIIGAICGIGGGVITKPVLDGLNLPGLATVEVSFLSSLSVLSMAIYSITNIYRSKLNQIDVKASIPLAIGAAIGGLVGKITFQMLIENSNISSVGKIQAIVLLILTIGTFLYSFYQEKIPSRKIDSLLLSSVVGFLLGVSSSFLGIGGGPINLVVLGFLFSMNPKVGAQNSLLIILFSQSVSMIYSFAANYVPNVKIIYVLLMIAGGLLGGLVGGKINKKITAEGVHKLFLVANVLIILISVYNIAIRS